MEEEDAVSPPPENDEGWCLQCLCHCGSAPAEEWVVCVVFSGRRACLRCVPTEASSQADAGLVARRHFEWFAFAAEMREALDAAVRSAGVAPGAARHRGDVRGRRLDSKGYLSLRQRKSGPATPINSFTTEVNLGCSIPLYRMIVGQ
ncbi:hypothetical protein ETB97_007973 [Aspergillus alliaceus]|uniref:Uncharacterized protein n=1 Tax=Petromyces alliaceus TaxID=209559 RepID=A0A8H6E1M8_PETAA|nr:hypothetical protein ETB97_007973 [Aspergillus burnettii]